MVPLSLLRNMFITYEADLLETLCDIEEHHVYFIRENICHEPEKSLFLVFAKETQKSLELTIRKVQKSGLE